MKILGIIVLFLVSTFFVQALYTVRLDFAEMQTFHTLTQDFSLPETSIETIDGKELSAAAMPAGPALIFFFGTWCRPCLMEHPLLVKLAVRKDIPFIGIGVNDTAQSLQAFLEKRGNPFHTVGIDSQTKWTKTFNASTLPVSYLTDGKGKVIYKFRGVLTEDFYYKEILPKIKGAKENALH